MSYTDNYLKLRSERQNKINKDVGGLLPPPSLNTGRASSKAGEDLENAIRNQEAIQKDLDGVEQELGGRTGALKANLASAGASMAENSPYLPGGQLPKNSYQIEREMLQGRKKQLKDELRQAQNAHYENIKNAPNFAEKSKYVSTATGESPYLADGSYQGNGFRDIDYDIINRNERAKRQENANGARDPLGEFVGGTKERGEMTDEEIAVFNYLYAQDEAKGDKKHTAAYEYIDYLTKDLNARERETKEEEYWKFGEEHPGWASAASVALSPMKAIGYVGQAVDYLTDGEIDENAGYNQYSHMTNAMRGAVSEKIASSGKWGKVGSFGYNIGMSLGDFLVSGAVTGGIASGAGALSRGATLGILSSGAAADTTIEAKDRGLSDDKAFTLGAIAGAAEIATEKLSLDMLLDGKWERGAVQYILKNSFVEGGEEVGADLINTLADIIISQDQSQWRQAVDDYMKAGYTESEAFGKAAADVGKGMLLSFTGGALAGGVLSAGYGPMVQQRGNAYRQAGDAIHKLGDESIQGLINEGLATDQNSEAHQTAKQLQVKLEQNEDMDSYELGKLLNETVREQQGADEEQYSLGRTEDGRPIAVVDRDILDGVPKEDWVATVKRNLKEKFPDGITVGNNKINIDEQSRKEMTFSRYMQWLYNNDPQLQADKLRATDNADDILYAAGNWVNEGLNHERKDKITDFARGSVLLRVGSNDYTADVLVGMRKNGSMLLYDVLNLTPTSFTKKETGAALSANPSPGAARKTAVVSNNSSISENAPDVNEPSITWGIMLPKVEEAVNPQLGQEQSATKDTTRKGWPYEPGMLPTVEQQDAWRKKQRAIDAATTELERSAIKYDVDENTFRRVERIANAIGKDVVFYSSEDVGENGSYNRGTEVISINARSKNPVAQIISHELTHSIEETNGYASFQELVLRRIEDEGGDLKAIRQKKKDLYARHGKMLRDDNIEVDKEIVSEYVEKNLLTDEQSIRNLVKGNRSLGQHILDWISKLLAKLKIKGAEERVFLTRAQNLYRRALAESAMQTNVRKQGIPQQGNTADIADRTMDMVQYSFSGITDDGIEVYETSEEVRQMPYRERMKKFLEIMGNEYQGRTAKFTANGKVYYAKFDNADVRKNIYGDKKSSPGGQRAKINVGADGDIFELVENAKYDRSAKERGKTTASHKKVEIWDYFVKTVQIDGQVYDLLANIRKKPDGEYVYSIQLNENKNKTSAPARQYQNGTAEAENRPVRLPTDVSEDSVTDTKLSVKEQFSISETLEDDLEKVLDNKFPSERGEIYIGETSNFLTDVIGADSLVVTMPASKAYSAMVTENKAKEDGRYDERLNYHGLGFYGLIDALNASENPVAAFADTNNETSKRSNNIVLVTDRIQVSGNSIAVVQAMNTKGRLGNKQIQANKIITTYDRAALAKDIEKAALEGRLLYLDKKRSQTLLAGRKAANSPTTIRTVDFKKNIQDFWDNVKWAEEGKDSYTTGNFDDETSAFARAYEEAKRKKDEQYSISEQDEKLKKKTTREFLTDLITGKGKKQAESTDYASEAEAVQACKKDLDEYWDSLRQMADVVAPRTNPEDKVSTKSRPDKESIGEKAKEGWSYFQRKMVDSGEAVSRVGKAVGDKNLYHYYNMARSSSNAATSMIMDARTDIYGRRTGKGLNEIMDAVRNKGDDYYKKFQLYLFHMHNMDRMNRFNQKAIDDAQAAVEYFRMTNPEMLKYTDSQMERMAMDETDPYCIEAREYIELRNALGKAENTINKPVFGFDVTAEDSKAIADKLLRENPDFTQEAQEVYDYIDNLMRYRVDSGLITEGDYQKLKNTYPHYVPTYRTFEREGMDTRQMNKVQIGSTIKRATGSGEKLMPLHKAIAQQTMSVVREGSKNRFGQRLLNSQAEKKAMDHVREIREYRSDFNENTFDQSEDTTFRMRNTFVVRENGKLWEMEVSPALYEAVEALSPPTPENNVMLNVIRKANNFYKALITGYNPFFAAKNVVRDFQDAELYSKNAGAFTGQYIPAMMEIAANGEYWRQYKALGGTYSTIFDYNTGEVEKGGWLKQNIFGKMEAINMGLEQAPRLAEFMATVKKAEKTGSVTMDTLMEAMYNAADITVNFGRSGTIGKAINANFVPFFNPGIQGFSKTVRRVTETKGFQQWLGLIGKAALIGITPTLLNAIFYGDDDEWDALKQRDKDTNFLFKTGDHSWFKMPQGRATSLLTMTADRMAKIAKGEEVDWGEFFSTAASQNAPPNPLEDHILKAWFDADLFDKDSPGETWYGSDIESQRLRNYAPGERYDASTDAISKWLGKTFNLSPKKINYLLDQYTGVAGDIILPHVTLASKKGVFGTGLLPATNAAFFIDSNYSNRYSNDFYEKKNELTYAKNGGNATGVDEILYKHWNRQGAAVSEVNKAIREIEADTTLSNKEKRELGAAQHAIGNGIMKQALESYDDYAAAVERHYSQSDLTDEDDRINEAYRKANLEVFGAEYALKTYSKDAYAMAEKLHQEQGLSYDKFCDFYFAYKASGSRMEGYRAAIDVGLTDREQMAVFAEIMPESEYRKLQTGYDFGITPNAYITYREYLARYDSDGNGSFNQKEAEAAIDAMVNMNPEEALLLSLMGEKVNNVALTNVERAVLWQISNKSWKPQNNPYSPSIGQQVYNAMHGGTPGVLGELRLPM